MARSGHIPPPNAQLGCAHCVLCVAGMGTLLGEVCNCVCLSRRGIGRAVPVVGLAGCGGRGWRLHCVHTALGLFSCDAQYNCSAMYEICRIIRAFDPNFADAHINAAFIDSMAATTPLAGLGLLPDIKCASYHCISVQPRMPLLWTCGQEQCHNILGKLA